MLLFWKSTDYAAILDARDFLRTGEARKRFARGASWRRAGQGEVERLFMKKTEIEERVRDAHSQLLMALEGLSEEQGTQTGLNAQWSVRDALSHIVAWEIQGADAISDIQNGTWKPQRLTKELIDNFNARAVEERRERSLAEVRAEFDAAHSRMQSLIASLPDEVEEASPSYKFIEGVTFKHMAHHAAQIEEWKRKQSNQ